MLVCPVEDDSLKAYKRRYVVERRRVLYARYLPVGDVYNAIPLPWQTGEWLGNRTAAYVFVVLVRSGKFRLAGAFGPCRFPAAFFSPSGFLAGSRKPLNRQKFLHPVIWDTIIYRRRHRTKPRRFLPTETTP